MAAKVRWKLKQARPGIRRRLGTFVRSGKLAALLLVGVSAWAADQALSSPRFTVHTVRAEGNDALTVEDVAKFADVQGASMWSVQTVDIERRVAESPYVEAVKVRLQLPDVVVVAVRERRPNVRWLHDGQTFAVTPGGLIVDQLVPTIPLTSNLALSNAAPAVTQPFTSTTSITNTALPSPNVTTIIVEPKAEFVSEVTVVDTTPNRPLKVRDYVDPDAVELARRVVLRATELPQPIARIEWDAGQGVSLIMSEGRQVILGHSNDLDRKLATLRFLLGDGTQFTKLDLRPNAPYYK